MVDFLREYVFDVRVETVLGKSFQGFSEEESIFLQLSFTTLKSFQRCKRLFRNKELHPRVLAELPPWFVSQRFDWYTFESDVPPLCHAMQWLDIPSTSWINIHERWRGGSLTRCAREYFVPTKEDITAFDDDQTAQFHVATFDIECFSANSTWEDQTFPDAEKE